MTGWVYACFDAETGPAIHKVVSIEDKWNMYGDEREYEYHDALFVRKGTTSPQLSVFRWQLHKTYKEARNAQIRTLRASVNAQRREIKSSHEWLKAKSRELAKLEATPVDKPSPSVIG